MVQSAGTPSTITPSRMCTTRSKYVMITHNPEATTYFDRVVHMRDGVIVDGVPAD